MSAFRNPGYEGVRELCASLGYGSDLKKHPRSSHTFRVKIAKHRRTFMNTTSNPTQFPLDCNDTLVRDCVSNLLEGNSVEFMGSQDW